MELTDLLEGVEKELRSQVDKTFGVKNLDILQQKVFELVFSWFIKGINAGRIMEQESRN